MNRIGSETIVLYAELRERLETFEAMRTIASLQGEFTTKQIKGILYHYFQATLPGGRAQIYLGRDSEEVRRLIDEYQRGKRDMQLEQQLIQRLAAQIIAGGVVPVGAEIARVTKRLADSAVFKVGGVLVGSIAFHIMGIHLGVQWDAPLRATQDVDVASGSRVALAVPNLVADVPAALDSLQMGFFPVPRLSNKEPSTSYAIRGKTLRIDLLTPTARKQAAPIFIRRLNAAAQPLRFLDYLIGNPVPSALVAGNPCLVNIPQPARFALHKLIVAGERVVISASKKRKDLDQAAALLQLLKEDRPGDLQIALDELEKRGRSWMKRLTRALQETGLTV